MATVFEPSSAPRIFPYLSYLEIWNSLAPGFTWINRWLQDSPGAQLQVPVY